MMQSTESRSTRVLHRVLVAAAGVAVLSVLLLWLEMLHPNDHAAVVVLGIILFVLSLATGLVVGDELNRRREPTPVAAHDGQRRSPTKRRR